MGNLDLAKNLIEKESKERDAEPSYSKSVRIRLELRH